jgi:hypothetical protein
MIKMKPFSYSGPPPKGYTCNNCKITNVKLWREYNIFLSGQRLLCRPCVEEERKEHIKTYAEFDGFSDQIGGMVPAVPVEDGTTFWGYSSIPPEGVAWWYRLPPLLLRKRHPITMYTTYLELLKEWDSIPKQDRKKRLDELVKLVKDQHMQCSSLDCHKESYYSFCIECLAALREDIQCPHCKDYLSRHTRNKNCPQCGKPLKGKPCTA